MVYRYGWSTRLTLLVGVDTFGRVGPFTPGTVLEDLVLEGDEGGVDSITLAASVGTFRDADGNGLRAGRSLILQGGVGFFTQPTFTLFIYAGAGRVLRLPIGVVVGREPLWVVVGGFVNVGAAAAQLLVTGNAVADL